MKLYAEDLDRFELYTYEEMSENDKTFDMSKSAYEIFSRVVLRRFKETMKSQDIKEVASMTMDFRNPFKLPHVTASMMTNGQGEDGN